MSIFDSISAERKRQILLQTQDGLISELVPLLIRNAIDPWAFDETDPEPHIAGKANPIDEARCYQICDALQIIAEKLS